MTNNINKTPNIGQYLVSVVLIIKDTIFYNCFHLYFISLFFGILYSIYALICENLVWLLFLKDSDVLKFKLFFEES